MTHTSQAELMALAQKHTDNPGVRALLLSINEAQGQAKMHLGTTGAASATLARAAQFEEGFWVGVDHADFVATAAKASAALSRISTLLVTLASLLSALGETVTY